MCSRGLSQSRGSPSIRAGCWHSGPKTASPSRRGPWARLILLGGAPLEGPRYIWWNFVASNREKIDAAKEEWRKADWGCGLFDLPLGDRDEFIPLPA
jgi:hypothetical protein